MQQFRRRQRLCLEPSNILRLLQWVPNAIVLYIKTMPLDLPLNPLHLRLFQDHHQHIRFLRRHHLWLHSIPRKPCQDRKFRVHSTTKTSAASRTCAAKSRHPNASHTRWVPPRHRPQDHHPRHRRQLPHLRRLSSCHLLHSLSLNRHHQDHATAESTREVIIQCTDPCTTDHTVQFMVRCPVQAHHVALSNRTIALPHRRIRNVT